MTLPLAALLQGAVAGEPTGQTYVDDVFSTYLYTGTGSTQTINNGIDLAGKGGLVWTKGRDSATTNNWLVDTVNGPTVGLRSNTTNAGFDLAGSGFFTGFTSSGFTLGGSWDNNTSGQKMASWTFRKAPKFFDVVTWTGNDTGQSIPHNLGVAPGMVIVKAYSGASAASKDWYVYHRSVDATTPEDYYMVLNTTATRVLNGNLWGAPTSTHLVLNTAGGVNETGHTYVAYLFAHDTTTDGIIQCGSFTTDGSGNATVNLGWEPQFALFKPTSAVGSWFITDVMRGWTATTNGNTLLYPNSSGADDPGKYIGGSPSASGIAFKGSTFTTYIYLAIRRPNKPPTSGTQVYNASTRNGNNSAGSKTGVGFSPDLWLPLARATSGGIDRGFGDRLRGNSLLNSATNDTETTTLITSFDQDGVTHTGSSSGNSSGVAYIDNFFRRAPGVFETFCDTGTGANKTETHGLSVAPELWLRKGRSGTTEWVWGSSLLANTQKIVMPSPNGVVTDATAWNSTYPTATSFSIGTAAAVNTNAATYVTYLWATKAGVSKVFTYTGDGGSGKVINCGFTAGARFILIIRTTASTAQDIFIWDSARGIIAGNDPHLSLNTSAAEVTTDDSVDPDNSGFAINQVAATNINVNGAVYIGVAYA